MPQIADHSGRAILSRALDDEDEAERADALRRYARGRSGSPGLFALVTAFAFALSLQFATVAEALAIFMPALAAEAAERMMLRRVAAMADARRLMAETQRCVVVAGALNTAVMTICLLALWRTGGPGAAPLVMGLALVLSVYAALLHRAQPRLHRVRQAGAAAAYLGPGLVPAILAWPDLDAAGATQAVSDLMVAGMLGVIYSYLQLHGQRRARVNRDLRHARREAEERLRALDDVRAEAERASLHDALTGLPNRRYLDRMLADLRPRAGAATAPNDDCIALLLVDLDRFKATNDTLGHDAGDAVLRHVAGILTGAVREGDFVARIGGDEFLILAPARAAEEDLRALADRIIARARAPLPYGDHVCRFGASIGIAAMPREGARPDQLLINADMALYRAKERGRGRAEVFSDALQEEVSAANLLGDDILRGLENAEFIAFYQPQLHAADLSVAGVEAVARWRHPQRGLLPPSAFLDAAAGLGALAEIDRMILTRALADRAALAARGVELPRLSVNVCAARLAEPGLADEVAAAGLPRGALAFELGASADAAAGDDRVRWTLERLADLGVDLEVDDFGAGPASVATLMALRPIRVKLDRQFVAPLADSPDRRALAAAMVALARSLGIGAVATGVETPAHAALLRDMGCERLQGFAFAAPMPVEALAEYLGSALRPAAAGGGR